MNTTITAWLVAAMLQWVPAQDRARYTAIAEDALSVVMDPSEPPLFQGAHARERTALLLLAIASLESHYRADVDDGRTRGDQGASVGLLQLNLPGDARILISEDTDGPRKDLYYWARGKDGAPGWGKADIIADRKKCFRAGLRLARESLRVCKNLSLYTMGRCSDTEPKAKHRLERARAWAVRNPLEAP
jgi:hypothetical protein